MAVPLKKPDAINPDRKLINTTEVSQIYCIKTGTLRYWRSVGIGPPYYKIGRAILYDILEFERFLQGKKVTPEIGLLK